MEKIASSDVDIKSCYFDVKFPSADDSDNKIIDQFKTEAKQFKTEVKSDSNSDDRITDITDFLSILEKKCGALLIVNATGPSEKWTLAIFDDVRFDNAREFHTIIIDDSSHTLLEELKKKPTSTSPVLN